MAIVINKKRFIGTPKNAVYIGRGSKWGNPFIIGKDGNRDEVCNKYEEYAKNKFTDEDYKELKGKDLICFCAPLRCHGDFLLKMANKE